MDKFDRKNRGVLNNGGVITHTPSHLPGILSFLLTGVLFAAALILTFSQALAGGYDEGRTHDVPQLSSACRDAQGGEQEV